MNKQAAKRLMAKGLMTYVAMFSLVLLLAIPALAVFMAPVDSVDSEAIKNGQVKKRDISKRAVIGKKIAKNAVRSFHIKNRTIKNIDIKRTTKTKHLSVPVAAFTPELENIDYHRSSDSLSLLVDPLEPRDFYAPINLPDGARITSVRFKCENEPTSRHIGFYLRRKGFFSGDSIMANISPTPGIAGWQYPVDTGITDPVINNKDNLYTAQIWINKNDGTQVKAGGILIKYKVKAP